MASVAEQDYIKSIFTLQLKSGSASTSALAERLNITPASVSGMLKKLDEAELISHEPYRGVKLTKRGERYAASIIRRHRLVELFLVKVLGMPWEEVHHEAEVLEHAISDAVLDRIDELLDYPDHDPHGSPIPTPKGKLPITKTVSLIDLQPGQNGVVSEVEDDNPVMLRHLQKIGLVPGSKTELLEILAVDGTRVVKCEDRRHSISPLVASSIRVELNN